MQKRDSFPFGADQLIRNLLECFLIKLIRERETVPLGGGGEAAEGMRTGEILRYLENNYREKITLEELCFLFGTNKTTLTKDFRRDSRRFSGISPETTQKYSVTAPCEA
jgi:hypothetical protein